MKWNLDKTRDKQLQQLERMHKNIREEQLKRRA